MSRPSYLGTNGFVVRRRSIPKSESYRGRVLSLMQAPENAEAAWADALDIAQILAGRWDEPVLTERRLESYLDEIINLAERLYAGLVNAPLPVRDVLSRARLAPAEGRVVGGGLSAVEDTLESLCLAAEVAKPGEARAIGMRRRKGCQDPALCWAVTELCDTWSRHTGLEPTRSVAKGTGVEQGSFFDFASTVVNLACEAAGQAPPTNAALGRAVKVAIRQRDGQKPPSKPGV